MTMRVYRARPGTAETWPVSGPVTVPTGDPERPRDNILVYPPCACARHNAPAPERSES